VTNHLTPDAVEVLKHLGRCLGYLSSRTTSVEAENSPDDLRELREMIEVVRACERAIRGGHTPPTILLNPQNWVCVACGSAEIECLDWIRVNDDTVVGGKDVLWADDYWCPKCEIHKEPVQAKDYCAANGHRESPCAVCGASVPSTHSFPKIKVELEKLDR